MADAAALARSSRQPRWRRDLWVHLVLMLGALVMVAPFVLEVVTSVKTFAQATHTPPSLIPRPFHWSNYSTVFESLPFGRQLVNTVVMTLARTLGQVLLCSAAGFAFARLEFRGRGLLFGLFLSVLMVPSQLFLLPNYQIMQHLGLLNSITALWLPGIFSAFGTFLMRQFFMQLPRELEEAARLDGANPFQVYWWVMLPLAAPALTALGILTAIWSWNDLLWPLIVNTDPSKMPVSAGLAALQGEHLTNYPVLMAGSLLASIPMIALFVVFQRQVLQGIAFTGLKG
ncbi:MAG: carbohydrate ABC transporter permease [Actinomycetes bacterium]